MTTVSPERWRRIEALLDGVLDLPPERRSAWLERECAGDEALRAAVEKLAAACEEPTRLPPSPAGLAAPLLAEADAAAPPPDRVGPWRILHELGHGGMGTVYLAERGDDQFHKRVAVKLLGRGLRGDDLVRRFRHERQILATLDHPNIARLLDGGVADGAPYIVMEYVDGLPLGLYCTERRLDLPERLALFADVCGAVQYAHQNLVVHRDLKPSNILVTGDGQVKLLDFGIAKLLDSEGAPEATALTRTGMYLMTPEYAAPEQVRGGRVTTATDVYALGVLLYELLVGRRPYDLQGRTPSEIERVVCGTEPTRPSSAAGSLDGAAARRLQGDLDTIILKALRKEPERRYPSVLALLDDLRRYREGQPVLARPDTLLYRARKFAGRHRVGVGLTALVAAAVGFGVVRERGLRAAAEAEAAKAVAVKDFLVGVFEASDPYGRSPEDPGAVTAAQLLERGRTGVDSALAGQPEVQAEMLSVLGRVYSNLGLYDEAAALVERSVTLRRGLHGDRHLSVATTETQLADVYQDLGQYQAAESLLTRALALGRELHGTRSEAVAYSLDRLATAYQEQSRYDEAEPLYREALEIRTALLGPDHLDVAESKLNLALLLWWKGDYDGSERLAREAMDTRRAQLGPRHALVSEAMHNLAQVQQLRGELAEAEDLFRESLVIKREVFGNVHPRVTVHLNNYARVLRDRGKYAEAEPLYREALALDRQIFGEEHPYVAASLDNLAALLTDRGKFAEADSLHALALAMHRRLLGERHVRVAFGLYNIAMLRYRQGDLARAEATHREALAIYREIYGPDHLTVMVISTGLAAALRERGALAEAEAIYRAAKERFEPGMPQMRTRLGPVLVGLGRTLVAAGRPAEALPQLERGLEIQRDTWGEADWRTAEARLGLGTCLAALGRRAEAAPLLRRSRDALRPFQAAQPVLVRWADEALAAVGS